MLHTLLTFVWGCFAALIVAVDLVWYSTLALERR